MKINLTKEEARILDNELFVAQRKLAYLNLHSVDDPQPSKEELRYKEVVGNLRVKLGKALERQAVNKVALNE